MKGTRAVEGTAAISEVKVPEVKVPEITVTVVESADALAPYAARWDELAVHASEPNMFYERWALIPALEHLAGKERVQVLLVTAGTQLLGLMPIVRRSFFRGLPGRYVANWRHIYCFAGTPLMRKGEEKDFLDALFAWARDEKLSFVKLCNISWTDRLGRLIEDYTHGTGQTTYTLRSYQRAQLDSALSGEAYLEKTLSSHAAKRIRRSLRQLEKEGAVRCRAIEPGEDIAPWIDAFVAMEKGGWKGRAGTALACNPKHESFFMRMTQNAHAQGKAMFYMLEAGGKAVAITANYRSEHCGWGFKVAFDETYRKCSPGLLLEVEGIKMVLDDPAIALMDSCCNNAPKNTRINQLWTGRLAVRDGMISVGPGTSAVMLLAGSVEVTGRRARNLMKKTYYSVKRNAQEIWRYQRPTR